MCLVGFRLLDSVGKDSAAPFISRKQVASSYAGWSEVPRCCVGGLVSNNETCCSCVGLNLPSLWHRALAAVYGWAGHVARKDNSHPGHVAILWRNVRWWEIMKCAGTGSRDHSWRHRRTNWVRCYEHGLARILGVNWWEVANLDREKWNEGKYKFVCDAVRRWGGPKPLWKKAFVDGLAVSRC